MARKPRILKPGQCAPCRRMMQTEEQCIRLRDGQIMHAEHRAMVVPEAVQGEGTFAELKSTRSSSS